MTTKTESIAQRYMNRTMLSLIKCKIYFIVYLWIISNMIDCWRDAFHASLQE